MKVKFIGCQRNVNLLFKIYEKAQNIGYSLLILVRLESLCLLSGGQDIKLNEILLPIYPPLFHMYIKY